MVRAVIVNKRELAKILGCSEPTIYSLMERYSDFPIEERGTNGKAYAFDAEKCTAFLRQKRQEEERAAAERLTLFDQFTFDLEPEEPARPGSGLSPSQQLSLIRVKREERKMAMEAGELVMMRGVLATLSETVAEFGRFLDGLPALLQRQHNLPEGVIREVRATIENRRAAWYADLERKFKARGAGHDRQLV